MALIAVEAARPGMILASDVRDGSGRLLLSASNEISERVLRIFQMWGITELEIEGAEPAPEEEPEVAPDPALVEEAGRRADHLFRHGDPAHPLTAELRRLYVARTAHRLARGTHGR
jgi:hypothetical protein